MINSSYINDILNKLIETESDYDLLKSQIDLLEIKDLEYTCTGLFVHFNRPTLIEKFKISQDKLLDGLIIKANELEMDAEAMLFIENGLIDYLEIWSHSGEYPNHEIMNYELIQGWIN